MLSSVLNTTSHYPLEPSSERLRVIIGDKDMSEALKQSLGRFSPTALPVSLVPDSDIPYLDLYCLTGPYSDRGIVFPADILRIPESSTALSEFSRGGK
jgi:hypothetical protein